MNILFVFEAINAACPYLSRWLILATADNNIFTTSSCPDSLASIGATVKIELFNLVQLQGFNNQDAYT